MRRPWRSRPRGTSRCASARGRSGPHALVVTGEVTSRRGDRMVLYLARRCEPTVARARRHYVIAYGPRQRPGASEFRATLSRRVVTPRQGRACLLLAGRDGRRLRQDSARYAV